MSEKTIEELQRYHQMAKFHSPALRLELKNLLNITENDEKRLVGLDNEDEFVVMIHALEWVKSLSGNDESIAQITKTKTTDLFVETKKGKKLSIEVKSSKENEIKFTKKLVESKIAYSQEHSHECYFAIKLKGHWMLFSGDYILQNNCKISLENDFLKSEMNNIFGERLFLFNKGLEIITNYSKSKEGICGITNEYGNAVRIAIKVNGRRKFLITEDNPEYVFMSIVLESIENTMSNQEQIVKKIDSDKTVVIERLKENLIAKFSNILMAPILHTINLSLSEKFTFQTYIEELKKKEHKSLLNRELVLGALSLFDDDYKVLMSFDNVNFYWLKDLKVTE